MNIKMTAIVSAIRSPRFWGAVSWIAPGLALANPTGGDVVGGAAAISAPDANTVRIDQTTDSAVINWQSFSIDGHEFVIFNQPSVSSATLNRVIGENPSAIFGHIQANGRVFLINPNGVLFGQGTQVDVNGLVATTLDISPQDFMAGKFELKGSSDQGVINAGNIQTADGGFVVLAGDHVQNSGQIAARLGKVVLASGSEVTLDIKGNGLVSYAINAAAVTDSAGVENLGTIAADGGAVYMDARVARSLTATVVNNAGLVQARSITTDKRGGIYLNGDGGDVVNSGVLDASTAEAGTKGGTVIVRSTQDITLTAGSRISANGPQGGEIRVVAEKVAALNPGSVVEATGPGGFIELSGHQRLDMNGDVNLSQGTLLIDPEEVEILGYANTGANTATVSYVNEFFIEGMLRGHNDVIIVAEHQIRRSAGAFDNDDINGQIMTGTGMGTGGSLTLGIGTADGGFARGDGGGDFEHAIDLMGLAIRTDRNIRLVGGKLQGGVTTGDLESSNGDITVIAYADISVGNLMASSANGDIKVNSVAGGINPGFSTNAGNSIRFVANTLDLEGRGLFAPHITLTGHNGVTITNSTLAGGVTVVEDVTVVTAADTIDIFADDTADITIQLDPQESPASVTGREITIEGGNVTINNDILSAGHGDGYVPDASGADFVHIEATGVDDFGFVTLNGADIFASDVTVIGRDVQITDTDIAESRTEGVLSGGTGGRIAVTATGEECIEHCYDPVNYTIHVENSRFAGGGSSGLIHFDTDGGLTVNGSSLSGGGDEGELLGLGQTAVNELLLTARDDVSLDGTEIAARTVTIDGFNVTANNTFIHGGFDIDAPLPTDAGGTTMPEGFIHAANQVTISADAADGFLNTDTMAIVANRTQLSGHSVYLYNQVILGEVSIAPVFEPNGDAEPVLVGVQADYQAAPLIQISGYDVELGGNSVLLGDTVAITATRYLTTVGNEGELLVAGAGHFFSPVCQGEGCTPDPATFDFDGASNVTLSAGAALSVNYTAIAASNINLMGDRVDIYESHLGAAAATNTNATSPVVSGTANQINIRSTGVPLSPPEDFALTSCDGGCEGSSLLGIQIDYSHLNGNVLTLDSATTIDTSTSLLTVGAQATFRAPKVYTGDLDMDGTNLIFIADQLTFDTAADMGRPEGVVTPIYRPAELDPSEIFARFTPYSRPDIRLEQSIANLDPGDDGTALLIGVDEHLSKFPGTTFGFGNDGFGGAINIALNGVPVNGNLDNFIFIGGPAFTLNGLEHLVNAGSVVVIRPVLETAAILNETSQFSDEEEERRREQEQNGQVEVTESAPNGQVEQAPPAGAEECT